MIEKILLSLFSTVDFPPISKGLGGTAFWHLDTKLRRYGQLVMFLLME